MDFTTKTDTNNTTPQQQEEQEPSNQKYYIITMDGDETPPLFFFKYKVRGTQAEIHQFIMLYSVKIEDYKDMLDS